MNSLKIRYFMAAAANIVQGSLETPKFEVKTLYSVDRVSFNKINKIEK